MSSVTKNNQTIDRAFANAVARANQSIQRGLEQLLAWGMEECLTLHSQLENGKHKLHQILDKGYGWVLYHNGVSVSRGVKSNPGKTTLEVETALDELQSDATPNGWSGFVVAYMDKKNMYAWSIRFEELVQDTTIGEISMLGSQFDDIFKPI